VPETARKGVVALLVTAIASVVSPPPTVDCTMLPPCSTLHSQTSPFAFSESPSVRDSRLLWAFTVMPVR
jgi:hypothetical protein